jgi:hypothetical protein
MSKDFVAELGDVRGVETPFHKRFQEYLVAEGKPPPRREC